MKASTEADRLEHAYEDYRKACYDDRLIDPVQNMEVRQAFLSGIHWLNTRGPYNPIDVQTALCDLLGQSKVTP
jgi:hypothetical protein